MTISFSTTHNQASRLTPKDPTYREAIARFTAQELLQDAGKGDLTTELLFPKTQAASFKIFFRESGVAAGRQEINYFLSAGPKMLRPKLGKFSVKWEKHDGEPVASGDVFCSISGSVRDVLKIERVVLNVIGRMSGIATKTRRIVEKARKKNPNVLITPTRKTLWGLLDKRACVLGGGSSHRLSLYDAILVKDNHLDALGRDIPGMIEKYMTLKNLAARFFEVEVATREEALEAAQTLHKFQSNRRLRLPCFLMLDNFSVKTIAQTLRELEKLGLRENIGIEVSGGISEENVASYAATGADIISLGELTHSAKMLDVSMERISSR